MKVAIKDYRVIYNKLNDEDKLDIMHRYSGTPRDSCNSRSQSKRPWNCRNLPKQSNVGDFWETQVLFYAQISQLSGEKTKPTARALKFLRVWHSRAHVPMLFSITLVHLLLKDKIKCASGIDYFDRFDNFSRISWIFTYESGATPKTLSSKSRYGSDLFWHLKEALLDQQIWRIFNSQSQRKLRLRSPDAWKNVNKCLSNWNSLSPESRLKFFGF